MDRYRRGAQRRLGVDIILRILFKRIINRTDDSRRDRGMASGNSGHFWGLTLFCEYCLIDEKNKILWGAGGGNLWLTYFPSKSISE